MSQHKNKRRNKKKLIEKLWEKDAKQSCVCKANIRKTRRRSLGRVCLVSQDAVFSFHFLNPTWICESKAWCSVCSLFRLISVGPAIIRTSIRPENICNRDYTLRWLMIRVLLRSTASKGASKNNDGRSAICLHTAPAEILHPLLCGNK